ncbi:NAD-dependent epimerase/dehydratase family protein [Streptomyces sp. NBC_01352]|uniref:NAD-dependent epimerase/dehydratase family protein n=1 Tax=Streptomyces sp. NBC_01352 TaxID=2903834 RepID=UPI002E37D8DC|nr:NAD-dependent epimerase/dehydratase family protein [Streptomyces sp. NBC_01352]
MSGRVFRRALVTGGAGFVGSHLCRRLLATGAEVVCLDNLATGSRANVADLQQHDGFRFVRADATDPAAWRTLPGRFDLVLHFACPASPADYLRLPLETLAVGSDGTRHALERASRDDARFVLASTSEVYGDPLEHPQTETYWGNVNPVGPRSVYDESKRFGEALVTAHRAVHGTDAAIVRIFNTYGPRMRGGDGRAVPTFIAQALDGAPLSVAGDGGQTRSQKAIAPRGRLRRHLAVTAAGAAACGLAVAGRRRAAATAALGWAVGTGEFARARIVAGPRTRYEVTTMLVTSALIPPAATWHWLNGLWRHRHAPAWREVAP